MISENSDPMEAEIRGISCECYIGVVLLNLGIQCGLGLGWPDRIMIAREYYRVHPIWKILYHSSQLAVLLVEVFYLKMSFLARVYPDTVYTVSGHHEIANILRQRIFLEPLNHLLPLGCQEGPAAYMYVRKECYGDGCV